MLLCEFIMNTSGSGANTAQLSSTTFDVAEAYRHEQLLYHTLLELYLAETLSDELATPSGPEVKEGQASSGKTGLPTKQPGKAHLPTDKGTSSSSEASHSPISTSAQSQTVAPSQLARRMKALELLQKGWPPHLQHKPKYDADHALVLCRLHVFR
jgi:hypothetical protein